MAAQSKGLQPLQPRSTDVRAGAGHTALGPGREAEWSSVMMSSIGNSLTTSPHASQPQHHQALHHQTSGCTAQAFIHKRRKDQ